MTDCLFAHAYTACIMGCVMLLGHNIVCTYNLHTQDQVAHQLDRIA